MGFDIIATEDGFKILEINSHEGIEFNQYYFPYMKHESTRSFFNRLFKMRGIECKEFPMVRNKDIVIA